MIRFCAECGTKVEYKFSPPKFCSQCGSPMGVVNANEAKKVNKNLASRKRIEAISDDETDADSVPQISKLEYEIDTFGSEYTHTMGSLAGKEPLKRRKIQSKNLDDLLS